MRVLYTQYSLPFHARIAYRYKVGARYYVATGGNLSGYEYGSRVEAERVVALYPVGTKVKVYYDPSDPAIGLLEPGGGTDLSVLIGVAGVLGLLCAVWVWFAW